MITLWIFSFLVTTFCTAIDYEDNGLAKACRPIDRQLDLLFILDGSGSVSGNTFDTQMAMLNKLVEMVDIGPEKTQIAVMQYSSYTRMEFSFTANPTKEKLEAALSKVHHISGTTKTGKALDKALTVFKHAEMSGARVGHEDVAQVAVVVSDGHSHDDPVPAAQRLRHAGVQILSLGIGGAHINMGELSDITGDNNLAFANLTTQASLDKFVSQFKKIAVGEHCDYSRGPHGAAITCNSDSVSIGISTVNPFYGHLYVVGQFHRAGCAATARNASKEIQLTVGLTSCAVQKQFMLNPKGVMFETKVVLKFHPHYNTQTDKVFNVQCFYPEKATKVPKALLNNRLAITDSSEALKMPCSYKLIANANDQCKVEDARVGDQLVHSWVCDREIFDTYQSMLIHSCVLVDLNSGINRTVIDENGCSRDPSVMETPDYVEPLTALAVGKAVKFPDSPLIQMRCQLRFCDRLLGECDGLLPPRCRDRRGITIFQRKTLTRRATPDILARAFDVTDDGDYDEQPEVVTATLPPLVTFAALDRKGPPMPPRRRAPVDQHVFASAARQPNPPLPTPRAIVTENLFPPGTIVTGIEPILPARPIITSGKTSDGQPRVINFPVGGMDFKLNTQDVAIVGNDRLKEHIQQAMKARTDDSPAEDEHVELQQVPIESFPMASKKNVSEPIDKESKPTKTTTTKATTPATTTTLKTTTKQTTATTKQTTATIKPTSKQPTTKQPTATTTSAPKRNTPPTTSFNTADPFQQIMLGGAMLIPSDNNLPEVSESNEELEPAVRLEKGIASGVKYNKMAIESQVLNIRDLEIMRDPLSRGKWCKK